MTLSAPRERQLVHTRSITYQAYRRSDGLWDVEARLADVKTRDVPDHWQGGKAGKPFHEMLARLTIDDDLVVVGVETAIDRHPLEMCPGINPSYQSLCGLKIGPGWRAAVKERVGSVRGCTHLTELLYPMATVAMQSILPFLREEKGFEQQPGDVPHRLGKCHSWATDSPVVKHYHPELYTGRK